MAYSLKKTILGLVLMVCAPAAHAATISFDPQEKTLGPNQEFTVALLIDADDRVNAIDLTLFIPDGLEPLESSDGNSIINMWVQKPTYDPQTRLLSFSGIVPGGFAGTGGRLVAIDFIAERESILELRVDGARSRVFLNTSEAKQDALIIRPLILNIVEGRENISNVIPDDDMPEEFEIEIVSDPLLYSGKWTAVFQTQDKGSGLARYEIQESFKAKPSPNDWRTAESPVILKDQLLTSYIFVRAVDEAGNTRIASIPPREQKQDSSGKLLMLGILLTSAVAYLLTRYILKK